MRAVSWRCREVLCGAMAFLLLPGLTAADVTVQGLVVDLNGRALPHAIVTVDRGKQAHGATRTTVYSDDAGHFVFPDFPDAKVSADWRAGTRALGYRQVSPASSPANVAAFAVIDGSLVDLLFVLQRTGNQAASVPASAWLREMPDEGRRHLLITQCVACHQFPTAKIRAFASSLEQVRSGDSSFVRDAAWRATARYMRARTLEGLPLGSHISLSTVPFEVVTDPDMAFTNSDDEAVLAALMSEHLPRQFTFVDDYEYGAPHAVSSRTVVREFAIDNPNGIRETIAVESSPYLWVADSRANKLVRIDPGTGEQSGYDVPFDGPTGPHTLLTGIDDDIWVAMLDNSMLGRLNPISGAWQLWAYGQSGPAVAGPPPAIHDIAFDHEVRLAPDQAGRIWMTDLSNALISLNPRSGDFKRYPAPAIDGRSPINIAMYGIVMSADDRTLWYTQLLGNLGAFDTQTLEYTTVVQLPLGTGPRRLAITAADVLWVPLFGSGQILKYDAKSREIVTTYDLPDRASAPYAVTWDSRRQLLWVATSNADVIYRFDPATESFGVIPLPHSEGFLRMISIHPVSGELLTCYANLPHTVSGPRMALAIDLDNGDARPWQAVRRPPSEDIANMSALLQDRRCHNCHALDEPRIGPPYSMIAARHRDRPGLMTEVLAQKIIHGGGGTWGVVPMVANGHVSVAEARVMARWILSTGPE